MMKANYKFLIILSFLFLLSSCDSDKSYGIQPGAEMIFLKAAINETCQTGINFTGDDIYGYLITDDIIGSFWQIGGHPKNASNEMPDLGINIVVPELETGTYDVIGHFVSGKSFIYYIDENGYEYNSTINNSENVHVVFKPGSDFSRIEITFNNIEVYNPTLDKTKCINKFNYSYAY